MSAPRTALDLPLDGIRAVEASAGTGKTFTLATLYLRLLLERGLRIDEIVVATFTRAAAAELSTRLRERLLVADALLANDAPARDRDGDDGETQACRKVIMQALAAGVPLAELQQRARDARLAIDTALIGTLHGFCHRALAEFGFETGQALAQPELIDDLRALELEIVRDFWRRGSSDATTARLLAEVWKSPEALARQVCDPRWRGRAIEVHEPDLAALRAAFERARQQLAGWDAAATDVFERELMRCVNTPKTRTLRSMALQETLQWALAGTPDAARAAFDARRTESICAEAIAKLEPKGVHPDGPPFADLDALWTAHAQLQQAELALAQLPGARLLRAAHAWLASELPRRLAERNLMSHDQAVARLAAALADGERGRRAAARIRGRWKAALVDEFQDTDPQQWRVVQTLFGSTTLVLVGDPKQAIYGFRGGDVFAWLAARAHAAGEPLRLAESFRAGAGLCTATNALFSRPGAFIEQGIEHPDIAAAGAVRQRALLRDGVVQAALEVWWLDPEQVPHAAGKLPSKDHARAAIERACTGWIVAALQDAALRLRDKQGVANKLRARHFAVLVNSNDEAEAMQAAFARAGVPASCKLRASVYASAEAGDLALLLEALANPDDAGRARAARASLLLGDDAATIATTRDDAASTARLLEDVTAWAGEVQRHGPLAWLHRLLAAAAPRLLTTPAGERRVANYLQLAELLQDLHATSFGIADFAVRFARARVDASEDADAARLRLDTDADAVTIATVHAAKGLEYDIVLLPYAALGRDPHGKKSAQPALHWYHGGDKAARVAIGDGTDAGVQQRALEEIRAEDVRKFYVAVTRASALCVVPYGPTSATAFSAAYYLLQVAGRDEALPPDAAGCAAALRELCARAGDAARVVDLPQCGDARLAPAVHAPAGLHARAFTRTGLERDWQVWSFSRLVRGSANQAAADPQPGAGDVDAAPPADADVGGAAFGTAVHAVFEQTDFAAWRDVAGMPESAQMLIERCLRDAGLAGARAVEVAAACVRAALNATLPCKLRLCDVAAERRRAEIEFHLSLAPARAAELFALLHRHGYQQQRNGVAPERLHGLMTGKIDLTFMHDGRFHIIDWKTNRCPPYDDAALRAEIAVHDYDLQWLIYTLALHRWLRQRLTGYDYETHVGAVYYLFVRGMGEGGGIHVDRPPRGLIEALDALFDAHREDRA